MKQVEMAPLRTRLGVARSFEQDRKRARRKHSLSILLVLVFVASLGRVWLTTSVADRKGRVNQLSSQIEQIQVDLKIANNELDKKRAFALVADPAAESGLVRQGPRTVVALEAEAPVISGAWHDLAEDLQRGGSLLLSEARAGMRSEEGRGLGR